MLWKIVNNNDLQSVELSETDMLILIIYILIKVTVK